MNPIRRQRDIHIQIFFEGVAIARFLYCLQDIFVDSKAGSDTKNHESRVGNHTYNRTIGERKQ